MSTKNTLTKPAPQTNLDVITSFLTMNPEKRRVEIIKLVNEKQQATITTRSADDARRVKTAPPMFAPFREYILAKGKKGAKTSLHTLNAYQRAIEVLIDFANTHGMSLLRPADTFHTDDNFADAYHAFLADKYSPASQKQHRAAVSMFYKFLRWAQATTANPFADAQGVSDPVAPEDKNHHFSDDEIDSLLASAGSIDAALVLLAGHAGLRVDEITSLTWADVDGGMVKVVSGKGGRSRIVPMSKRLQDALAKIPRRDDRVLPFSNERARARLKSLCSRAGVAYAINNYGGMHRLRHSAGYRFYRDTHSLIHTAKLLGHASTETAKIYAAKNDSLIADTIASW